MGSRVIKKFTLLELIIAMIVILSILVGIISLSPPPNSKISVPCSINAEIIRSEYMVGIIKELGAIKVEDLRSIQQQAKDAWPDETYYFIHKNITSYDSSGYSFIMEVGPYFVFQKNDKMSDKSQENPSFESTKKDW